MADKKPKTDCEIFENELRSQKFPDGSALIVSNHTITKVDAPPLYLFSIADSKQTSSKENRTNRLAKKRLRLVAQ